jgi:5-methylcytosine-specific restriction endonuclease McrA
MAIARHLCFRCGSPVVRPRIVWCSKACEEGWFDNHAWGWARLAALRRDEFKCQRDPSHPGVKEVNHIDPRNGRGYHAGCHHHQDRLETLCHKCHLVETIRQGRERAIQTGSTYIQPEG